MKEKKTVISNRVLIRVLSLLILLANMMIVDAQQFKIGRNVSNLKPKVILELEDTAQALLLTRVFNPSSVIGSNSYRGMLVYDSSVNKLAYYDGTTWVYPITNVSSDTSIYKYDGSLSNNRRVNLNSKTLSFFNGSDSLYLNGGKVGISVNPISALQVKGAVRADSLVLLSNKLYKPLNTIYDSVAIVDSIGRLMKVSVQDMLNASTSSSIGNWQRIVSSHSAIVAGATIGGQPTIFGATTTYADVANAGVIMSNYMYVKDSIQVKYDIYTTNASKSYLRLHQYSDDAGTELKLDTLVIFSNGTSVSSGINNGSWTNNQTIGKLLLGNTRYIKLDFLMISNSPANSNGFKNVSINIPTVNTNSLNYVQGGNSFGIPGVLGLQDNNNLSIITNNTSRIFVDTFGRVGIGTTSPEEKLHVQNGGIRIQYGQPFSVSNAPGTGAYTDTIMRVLWNTSLSLDETKFSSWSKTPTSAQIMTFYTQRTEKMRIVANGNLGIGVTNPISKLHITGAVRADSLVLLSNKLYKPFNTSLDSIAVIDSIGRLMKVGVNDILNTATVSANNFDWTLSGYSSSSPWISKDIVVSGKQALYATTSATGYMWNATFYLTMTNYMYAKDTISVRYDAFAQAFSGRTGSYYLQLLEYSDLAGNLVQTDTLKMFLQSNTVGNSADLASGINTGWNNNLVTNIKLQPSTRYVKLQFVIVNKGTATAVTAAFSNVSISTPTVNTNSLNYVQGGNSFGTLGILGLQDKNNLSIITNNTERINIDSLGRISMRNVNNDTFPALRINYTGTNNTRYNGLMLAMSTGSATAQNSISFYNVNQNRYMGSIWNMVGGSYNSPSIGFSLNDNNNGLKDVMILQSNGNVGIGTTSPISRLQVSGAMRADSLALVRLLNKNSMTVRDSLLMIDSVGVVKKVSASTVATSAGSVSSVTAGVLSTTKNSNGITINPASGNVVINLQEADATNPGLVTSNAQTFAGNKTFTGQLTATNVPSGANTDSILTVNTGGNIRRIAATSIKPSTDTSIYSFDGTLKGNRIVTMGANSLTFNAVNGNFIYNPTGTGNVGIGLINPTQKLEVLGGIKADSLIIAYGKGIYASSTYPNLIKPYWNGALDAVDFYTSGENAVNATSKMTLLSNGNFGIGKTNPISKLHVSGAVRADSLVLLSNKLYKPLNTSLDSVAIIDSVGRLMKVSVNDILNSNNTNLNWIVSSPTSSTLNNVKDGLIVGGQTSLYTVYAQASSGMNYNVTMAQYMPVKDSILINVDVYPSSASPGWTVAWYMILYEYSDVSGTLVKTDTVSTFLIPITGSGGNVAAGLTSGSWNNGLSYGQKLSSNTKYVKLQMAFISNGKSTQQAFKNVNLLTFGASGNMNYVQGGNSFGNLGILGLQDKNNLSIITNNTSRIFVDTLGRVGIGTSTPKAKLSIGETGGGFVPGATPDVLSLGKTYSNAAGKNLKLKLIDDGADTSTLWGFGVSAGQLDYVVPNAAHVFYTSTGVGVSPTEKMRISKEGNVGIGTTSPSSRLHVIGDVRLSGTAALTALGANDSLMILQSGGDGVVKKVPASAINTTNIYTADGSLTGNRTVTMNANNLTFNSVNGNFIYNPTGTGKMGIGTASPARTLHVNSGGITADSLTLVGGNSMLKLVKGVSGNSSLLMEFYKNGTSISNYGTRTGYLGFGSSASTNFWIMNEIGVVNIGTKGNTVLTIDTFNQVGIGTTTPISALQVKGAVRTDSLVLLSNKLYKPLNTIYDSVAIVDSIGRLMKVSVQDMLNASTSSSIGNWQRIVSSHSAIVAGATIGGQPTIFGATTTYADVANAGVIMSNYMYVKDSIQVKYDIYTTNASKSYLRLHQYSDDAGTELKLDTLVIFSNGTSVSSGINNGSWTNNQTIGKLLLGNTRYIKLDFLMISNSPANSNGFKNVSINIPTVNTNSLNYVQGGNSFGIPGVLGLQDNNNLSIITNNTSRIFVDTFGRVGIGTTSPEEKLHVQNGGIRIQYGQPFSVSNAPGTGAYTDTIMRVFWNTSLSLDETKFSSWSKTPTSAQIMTFYTQRTEKMRIAANGNVGIGVTNPISKLHVMGDVRLSGTAALTALGANDSLMILQSGGDGVVKKVPASAINTTNIYTADGSLTGNRTVTMNANNLTFNAVNGNFIYNPTGTGKMGIGTASPARTLHVNSGGITADSLTLVGGNSMLKLVKGVAGNNPLLMEFYKNGTSISNYGTRTGYLGFGASASTNFWIMNEIGVVNIGTKGNTVLTIDTFNQVGIGTTTPISALQVKGAVRADSLVLLSNKLYKPLNTIYDSVAIVDSIGRLMKVGVSDILNATTSVNNFDWTYVQYSGISSDWLVKNQVVGGQTTIYGAANGVFSNVAVAAQMSSYMYAKDTVNVSLDVFVTGLATRPGIVGLRLLEYADAVGTLVQIDTLEVFVTGNIFASGILGNTWNNGLSYSKKLQEKTRYIKLEFYLNSNNVNKAQGFKNVQISTPTVNTNSLNYVQGGNSFGTLGILGLQDKNNLSIITNNTSRIFVDTIGRVGVGTSSPGAKLDVGGKLQFYPTGTDSSTTDPILRFVNTGWGRIIAQGTLAFFVNNNGMNNATNTAAAMLINTSGNVGIGTTSPTQKLSIGSTTLASTATPDAISLGGTYSSTAGQNLKIRVVDGGSQIWGFGVSNTQLDYAVPSGSSHVFYVNNAEQMRINSSGNVGIGTSPSSRLHVMGDVRLSGTAALTSLGTNDSLMILQSGGGGVVKKVPASAINTTNIYTADGSLTDSRTVTIGANNLTFFSTTGQVRIYSNTARGGDPATIEPMFAVIDSASTNGGMLPLKIQANDDKFTALSIRNLKSGTGAYNSTGEFQLRTFGSASGNKGKFGIWNSKMNDNALVIDSTNKIGIGTASPTQKLSIGSTTLAAIATPDAISLGGTFSNTAGQNLKIRVVENPSGLIWGFGVSSNQLDYAVPSNSSHVFYINNAEQMRINTNGNVGIGTTSPSSRLHVIGDVRLSGTAALTSLATNDSLMILQNGGGGVVKKVPASAINTTNIYTADGSLTGNRTVTMGGNNLAFSGTNHIVLNASTAGGAMGIRFNDNNVQKWHVEKTPDNEFAIVESNVGERLRIKAGGNVGIGTTTPGYKLDVSGDARVTGIIYTTKVQGTSDERLKKDISPIQGALSKILQLQGVSYTWRKDMEKEAGYIFKEGKDYGVIAQEIQKVLPELVAKDSKGFLTVDYAHITPVLIEAIKEQQKEIEGLKAKVKILDIQAQKVDTLQNEVDELKAMILEMKTLIKK